MCRKHRAGFTLVELSVVLVVVAFIVGAISYAKDLKTKAESRAVLSEMTNYTMAVDLFRKQYKFRPGDLPDAGRFFTGNAVSALVGDGNNLWDSPEERHLIWPQLFQAELITQNLAGTGTGLGASVAEPGVNRPTSRLDGAGWTFIDALTVTPPDASPDIEVFNVLRLGAGDGATDELAVAVLSIEEHRYLDSKIDEPNTPLTGRFIVGETDCADGVAGAYVYPNDANDGTVCTGNLLEVAVGVEGINP